MSAKSYLHHESVAALSGEEDRTLSLHKCLESFVAEEKIEEAYCSKCKEHRQGSLKTEFWRLPPVLVVSLCAVYVRYCFIIISYLMLDPQVHLKRFQFTAYSRRKLHNLVKFPLHDFDMSPYVVKEGGSDDAQAAGEEPQEDESGALGADDGRAVGDYELYAVVHHLVSLS